jgi:hypothetical protein
MEWPFPGDGCWSRHRQTSRIRETDDDNVITVYFVVSVNSIRSVLITDSHLNSVTEYSIYLATPSARGQFDIASSGPQVKTNYQPLV